VFEYGDTLRVAVLVVAFTCARRRQEDNGSGAPR
jgi:hypothetical protein